MGDGPSKSWLRGMREPVTTTSSANCARAAGVASAVERPIAPPIAMRIARAKGIDFFTIDPRRLRKYDNRAAIVMAEIYTHRLSYCYCGLKRTVWTE